MAITENQVAAALIAIAVAGMGLNLVWRYRHDKVVPARDDVLLHEDEAEAAAWDGSEESGRPYDPDDPDSWPSL